MLQTTPAVRLRRAAAIAQHVKICKKMSCACIGRFDYVQHRRFRKCPAHLDKKKNCRIGGFYFQHR